MFLKMTARLSIIFLLCLFSACSIHLGHKQVVQTDDFSLSIQAPNGDSKSGIRFNQEETALTALPTKVKIELSDYSNGVKLKLTIYNPDDRILYKYQIDGRSADYDADAQQWFSRQVPKILRETGIDAKGRINSIFARSGASGVLDEISNISSDHVKGIYLQTAINTLPLAENELAKTITLMSLIDSDYQLRALLLSIVDRPLSLARQVQLLEVSRNIQSDYELSTFLINLPTHFLANAEVQTRFFETSELIQSDHELKKLYVEQVQKLKVSQHVLEALLMSLSTIQSDHEMQKALSALLSSANFKTHKSELIKLATQNIQSDHELSQLLIATINTSDFSPELQSAIQSAALNMQSEHEKGKVLISLVEAMAED
jgi:hypothetical protein